LRQAQAEPFFRMRPDIRSGLPFSIIRLIGPASSYSGHFNYNRLSYKIFPKIFRICKKRKNPWKFAR
jgi:hypothetical protein